MRKARDQFVTNGDMSATITSNPVALDQDFGYSIQANYATSGGLSGVLKLQASVDYTVTQQGAVTNTGTWVDITNTPQTISGAGSFIWNVTDVMYPAVRLVYTPGGGDTGTLNAFIHNRGF